MLAPRNCLYMYVVWYLAICTVQVCDARAAAAAMSCVRSKNPACMHAGPRGCLVAGRTVRSKREREREKAPPVGSGVGSGARSRTDQKWTSGGVF